MTNAPAPPTVSAGDTLYCANHPQTSTALRCNKCNKPICTKCAVLTPVGYRCRECVRGQQQVFETARWYDYVSAPLTAAVLGGVAGALLTFLGWFVIFLSPVAGGLVAEVVRRVVGRRRGRNLFLAAAAGYVAGCLALFAPALIVLALALLGGEAAGGAGLRSLLGLLWPLVYTVIAAGTFYARLRGISVG
ncbi:MAG: hypothetical protein IT317_13225 [Anaerolineales bacterium]|nr:hypothetical protein [Anaerolineales bacterium]